MDGSSNEDAACFETYFRDDGVEFVDDVVDALPGFGEDVAALVGTNFLTGVNDGGELLLDDHERTLRTADAHTAGPVLVTVPPRAISLHPEQPGGSARNTWPTTVAAIEPMGETTRVELGAPLPLTVEVTPAAIEDLGLQLGSPIWAAVKATEINVTPS